MIYVLEELFKTTRSENSERLNLRIQRSLSWLKKAVMMESDRDLQCVSLWISLKAIFIENGDSFSSAELNHFIDHLYATDDALEINQIIKGKLSSQIYSLLHSPYTFQAYWSDKNQSVTQNTWRTQFDTESERIKLLYSAGQWKEILLSVLNRMHTIHHQILQGGRAYNSAIGQQLLIDSCDILTTLIPKFLELLINHSKTWHDLKPHYPVMHVS